MSKEVAKLFAKHFIARSDVKAIQRGDGSYNPVNAPFDMTSLLAHIEGMRTYGHYLLKPVENTCKLFAFDIDLDEHGICPTKQSEDGEFFDFQPCDLREFWKENSETNRPEILYMRLQMRMMSAELARVIHEKLKLKTAVAYTGAKGVHVYGFHDVWLAANSRKGAELVLKMTDHYEPAAGNNFFKYKKTFCEIDGSLDHELSFQNFTVEVFPKQTEVDADGYGNLMRLPLGVNLKNSRVDTFFVDMRVPLTELVARDPIEALTTTDQWL
jgi:hypothetical protein